MKATSAIPSTQSVLSSVTQARTRAQIEILEQVNAAAEADMLRGNPVTGAHHRAIEAKLKELRALLK